MAGYFVNDLLDKARCRPKLTLPGASMCSQPRNSTSRRGGNDSDRPHHSRWTDQRGLAAMTLAAHASGLATMTLASTATSVRSQAAQSGQAKLDDPTIVAIFDAANTWDIETG